VKDEHSGFYYMLLNWFPLDVLIVRVLVSEILHKGTNAPSVRRVTVDYHSFIHIRLIVKSCHRAQLYIRIQNKTNRYSEQCCLAMTVK